VDFQQHKFNIISSPCGLTLQITTKNSAPWSALASINEVNRHRARLLLEWVTVCGQVNRLVM